MRVRYQEARHIGEALTRDALRSTGHRGRRTAVVDHRREPVAARPRTAWSRCRCPGTGPVHLVALDDGTACPTQVVARRPPARASPPSWSGQKIRWVLEMMRGPELAGCPHRSGRARTVRPTAPSSSRSTTPAPGEDDLDLEATKEALLALGEAGATISIRQRRAPVREVVFAAGSRTRLRLAHLPGGRRRRAPDRPVRADRPHARQRAPPRRGRPGRRHAHHRALTACASPARTATSTAATAATPTTTRRPRSTRSSTEPESVVRRGRRVGPGAGPRRRHRDVPLPTHADRRRAVPANAAATSCTTTEIVTTLELRTGERFLRVHVELDHRVRDHRLRAHFPLPAPGRRFRRRVRVRGRAPRAHRRGRPARVRACRRSCRGASSTARRRRRRSRAPARRSARVRGRRLGRSARSRSPCSAPPATSRGRSCRSDPTRPDRSIRSRDHSSNGRLAARLRGPPPPRRLARRVAPRRRRRLPRSPRAGAGWRLARGIRRADRSRAPRRRAPRSRPCCATHTGALVLRLVNLSPDPTDARRDAATTHRRSAMSCDLTGATHGPFAGRVTLRPWEILTLRLVDG